MPYENPRISIIIPVLNEGKGIEKLLNYLQLNSSKLVIEIIVVDGGSTDNTIELVQSYNVRLLHSAKGRSVQMNHGAKHASGEILYFLHADTFPPVDFAETIADIIKNDSPSGCFRMKFDSKNPVLYFFAWLTRFNFLVCRGGDQSLFVEKELFNTLSGFDENYMIYEDIEFIKRIYKASKFIVGSKTVVTSARKYREKGWAYLQFHFGIIHLKNFMGANPNELHEYYSKNILSS